MDTRELLRQQRERLEYWTRGRIEQQRREWERIGGEEMERARQYFPPRNMPARPTPPIGLDDVMEV